MPGVSLVVDFLCRLTLHLGLECACLRDSSIRVIERLHWGWLFRDTASAVNAESESCLWRLCRLAVLLDFPRLLGRVALYLCFTAFTQFPNSLRVSFMKSRSTFLSHSSFKRRLIFARLTGRVFSQGTEMWLRTRWQVGGHWTKHQLPTRSWNTSTWEENTSIRLSQQAYTRAKVERTTADESKA
jgi:hypothetical protein